MSSGGSDREYESQDEDYNMVESDDNFSDSGSDTNDKTNEALVEDEVNSQDESENIEDKPPGWAIALKKTLKAKKPSSSENVILSKAKKVKEIEQIRETKKGFGFEIENEIKQEADSDPIKLSKRLKPSSKSERRLARVNLLSLQVKPSFADRERERTFQKIATKGMVQLFNAVRAQQVQITEKLEEAGKAEYKRDKVLKAVSKKTFLDALMNGRATSELVDNPIKKEQSRKKFKHEFKTDPDSDEDTAQMWNALKDDFIVKSGWNKQDPDSKDDIKSEDEPDSD